jgi:hypothetical protein
MVFSSCISLGCGWICCCWVGICGSLVLLLLGCERGRDVPGLVYGWGWAARGLPSSLFLSGGKARFCISL